MSETRLTKSMPLDGDVSTAMAGIDPDEALRGALLDWVPMGLCLMVEGSPRLVNRRFVRMLGAAPGEQAWAPADLLRRWPGIWAQLDGAGEEQRVVACDLPDGSCFHGRAFSRRIPALGPRAELITLVNSAQLQWMAFSSDWQARMLLQTESLCRTGSAEVDLETGQTVVSRGLSTMVGAEYRPGAMSGWRLLRWVPREERGYVASIWRGAIVDEPFDFQHRLLRADGSRLEILHRGMVEVGPDGRRHGYLILQDITAQRKAEQRIQELANHDEVTGLANRNQLLDRIDAAVHGAAWDPRSFIVLSIQIKQIDELSQAMGYGAGDAMAMAVAARLSALVGPDDVLARVGSDEFAMFLGPSTCDQSQPGVVGGEVAARVVEALSHSERLGAAEIVPVALIGVASFPADARSAGQLLEAAQTARLGARVDDKRIAYFSPQVNEEAMRRLAIESGLRHAAEREELRLEFQVQIDLISGQAVGAEVQLGWCNAELGEVPAEEFLPVARQTGLIVMLGEWQLHQVCTLLQNWMHDGIKPPRLALNLSSLQLQQPDIVSRIQHSLLDRGVPTTLLGLQIAEQSLMVSTQDHSRKLSALRSFGLEVTLDDFGIGHSNLSLLRSLPVDVLKVHRSCVPDVMAASGAVSLTRAIINLAHSLQMRVLAEGVETEGQLTLLMANGCDRIQGDVLHPKVRLAQFDRLLRGPLITLPERFMRRQRERTLLLVDDEPSIVAALKRLFRRDGYRIVTASSGMEGLQRMAEYEVDVVLSDQRMPGMTGVEFLRRAKELYPDTVRMVLSGYTELQSITDAVNEGAIYRFLTKPWDDARLRVHVQEAFNQKGMADENRRLAQEVRQAGDELSSVNARLERVLSTQRTQIDLEEDRATTARDMIDLLPVPILGIDPDETVVMVNLEAQRLLGIDRLLIGEPASLVLPEALQCLCQGSEQVGTAVRLRIGDRYWRARARPFGEMGQPGHLVVLTEEEA